MRTFTFILTLVAIIAIGSAAAFALLFWLGLRPPYLGMVMGPFITIFSLLCAEILGRRYRK